MPTPVIAIYRPHPGKEEALHNLVTMHHGVLLEEGLASDFHPLVLRSKDGSLLEIFEWASEQASKDAHMNKAVQALWDAFGAVSEFLTLGNLAEADAMFPHFERVEL